MKEFSQFEKNKNHRTCVDNHAGFSLIEILVAMSLVAIMFMIIPFGNQENDHEKLEITLDNFDRAIRFASNESILRNAIVRIKIDFTETPSRFTVEAGPESQFVLPRQEDIEKLDSREKEALGKEQATVDRQFQPIADLDPKILVLDDNVSIIGAVGAHQKIIQRENTFSIYFYPIGEKDESMIFFATYDEVASLAIGAFEMETTETYLRLEENEKINLDNAYESKMRELYEGWIK